MPKQIDLNSPKSALYIRVSTHYQIDRDSLPLQKEDLINYSTYVLGIPDYEIFEDAGYSAKNTDRPSYQQMMNRLRSGEFTHLIVWKIDRISRNLLDFAAMYDELKRLGVVFVSKNEQFDTSTAIGEAMLKIILIFAELERKMTSERVTAVLISRATNGQWNGGTVPFGYDHEPKSDVFTINETDAETVRLIFSQYMECGSLVRLAHWLIERGYKTPKGIPWGRSSLLVVLRNPFYIGTYVFHRKNTHADSTGKHSTVRPESDWIVTKNHHPAIIDEADWLAVNEELDRHAPKLTDSTKTFTRKHTHIFSGLLVCGKCGSQIIVATTRTLQNSYMQSRYVCSVRPRSHSCDNAYVTNYNLAPFVLTYISNIIKAQRAFTKTTTLDDFRAMLLRGKPLAKVSGIEPDGLTATYDMIRTSASKRTPYTPSRINKQKQQNAPTERDMLLSERNKKERALARLKSLYLYNDSALPESEFLTEHKALSDDLSRIDARLAELEKSSAASVIITDSDFLNKASYFIMAHELLTDQPVDFKELLQKTDPKVIKDFLNSIITRIVVTDKQITSITFKNGIEHRFMYNV